MSFTGQCDQFLLQQTYFPDGNLSLRKCSSVRKDKWDREREGLAIKWINKELLDGGLTLALLASCHTHKGATL